MVRPNLRIDIAPRLLPRKRVGGKRAGAVERE